MRGRRLTMAPEDEMKLDEAPGRVEESEDDMLVSRRVEWEV